MDEKTKLYVFAKKEVALIFMFMILIGATSFVFGFRLGRNYNFVQSGYTQQDRATVDLLSKEEEIVAKDVSEKNSETEPSPEDFQKRLEERIQEELNSKKQPQEVLQKSEDNNAPSAENSSAVVETTVKDAVASAPIEPAPALKNDSYSGKYTIQLGSHRSLEEAEAFANGFKHRGYNPIINEVEIASRGTWYRVSLGVFDNISDAKDYVTKENSLFQGQDYVFVRFD